MQGGGNVATGIIECASQHPRVFHRLTAPLAQIRCHAVRRVAENGGTFADQRLQRFDVVNLHASHRGRVDAFDQPLNRRCPAGEMPCELVTITGGIVGRAGGQRDVEETVELGRGAFAAHRHHRDALMVADVLHPPVERGEIGRGGDPHVPVDVAAVATLHGMAKRPFAQSGVRAVGDHDQVGPARRTVVKGGFHAAVVAAVIGAGQAERDVVRPHGIQQQLLERRPRNGAGPLSHLVVERLQAEMGQGLAVLGEIGHVVHASAGLLDGIAQPQSLEHLDAVGPDRDGRAHRAKLGDAVDDLDLVTCLLERQGSGESAHAGADDENVQRHGNVLVVVVNLLSLKIRR